MFKFCYFPFQTYLRRRKYKLFACFLEATLVACTDGPVTFEISIGMNGYVISKC